MSREHDFAVLMAADTTLMATLTGGVFESGLVGREGITRETAAGAFDSNGYLKPCALVKQRALVPDGGVRDGLAQAVSATQVVEVWLYEDSGYTNLDTARARLFALLEGHVFSGAYPAEWVNSITRQRDQGALTGKSLERMDFQVRAIETV